MTDFVECSTQAQLDAVVKAGNIPVVRSGFFLASGSATVEAWGSATVRASGSATVEAWGSATVRASDSATVRASDSATVRASDSATVRASGSATVRAWGSATVEAWGSATVEAWGSATVRASDSATVRASGSATVEAWGSATVEAWGSATVRASGSATVRASDSATVSATPFVAVQRHGKRAKVKGGVLIQIPECKTLEEWAEFYGLKVKPATKTRGPEVIVYKAVDDKLHSGYHFEYPIGKKVEAPDWNAKSDCGGGLHFGPRPMVAKRYFEAATRFLECSVPLDALPIETWGSGPPDKIKAPWCRVLAEVDIDGERLK